MPEDLHASAENLSGAAATQRASALSAPRIAVLPFSNVSADPEQDYFCEGLAAEILIGLARIPGLHLAARSSVFALKREQLDLREVGRRLKVTTVLEGAVLLSEDRLRITVTLVDAATGKGLWSGRFDRALEEIFSVLDEITAGVAGAFEVKAVSDHVRKIQSIHTSDVEAYD